MTWNPLKKVTLQKPTSSKSYGLDDGELDSQVGSLQQLEEASRNLYKEAKKYKDTLEELHQCEKKTSSDLFNSNACQHVDNLRKSVEEYHSVVTQSEKIVQDLESICQKAVVDPLKRYTANFTNIQMELKKREQLLQECNRCQQKVNKYTGKEKTGTNIVKLQNSKAALNSAKDEVLKQNAQLLQEIPYIRNTRIEYFQPSLEALIRGQVNYYGETLRLYTDLAESTKNNRPLPDDQYQQQINNKLAEIKALSIVAND